MFCLHTYIRSSFLLFALGICYILLLIPVAVRVKAWEYGSSLAGIAVGVDVCLSHSLCFVRWRSLHRADRSSRGVLLTVVCLNECDPETSYWRPGITTAVEP